MKHLYFLSFALWSSVSALFAQQVTLTQNTHGLQGGDSHRSQKVAYKEPGTAGKGILWDFRDLPPATDAKSSLVEEVVGDHNVSVFREDGARFYFNVTPYANEYKGYETGGMQVTFNEPIIKVKYPFNYGSRFEGDFSGAITYNSGSSENGILGAYSTEADAAGTMLLPGNVSLKVLRVKTVERYDQWACSNHPIEFTKYLWYAQDVRYPVFVSLESVYYYPEKTVTEKYSYQNIAVDASNNTVTERTEQATGLGSQDIPYQVSPNPFADELRIRYTLPGQMNVHIELYKVSGARVATIVANQLQEGDRLITFNAARYAQADGIYILKMNFGDRLYTEKIVLDRSGK